MVDDGVGYRHRYTFVYMTSRQAGVMVLSQLAPKISGYYCGKIPCEQLKGARQS